MIAGITERLLQRRCFDSRSRARVAHDGIAETSATLRMHVAFPPTRSSTGSGGRNCTKRGVDSPRYKSAHERLIHHRLERRRDRRAGILLHHHHGDELLLRIDPEVRAVDAAPPVHPVRAQRLRRRQIGDDAEAEAEVRRPARATATAASARRCDSRVISSIVFGLSRRTPSSAPPLSSMLAKRA